MTQDWTGGEPLVLTCSCRHCGHRWYIARDFCPRCGATDPTRSVAAPVGVVVAVTSISPTLDPDGVGLSLALVDLVDGIRILARCESGLIPGESVRWYFPDSGRQPESGPWVAVVS